MLAASTSRGGSALSPLVQSYQQSQFNFNRPYGAPLPRDAASFLAGQFGPMAPVVPMPIDPPMPPSDRPEPRRFQYPVGWNLPVGQPGTEGIKLTTFATLRSLADMYSVARACIDKRKEEIVGLEWNVVPTDEAEKAMEDNDTKRADFEKRRAQVLKFFKTPDSDRAKYPTFESWLGGLLEDLFVLDAVALHMHPPRVKNAGPFHSNLASLDLLDGSTIRPLLNMHGSTPQAPEVAYQQYVWGVPRVDLTSVIMGLDIEDMSDQKIAEYRADQLVYLRYTSRDWTPYGFSPVEKALLPITIGLARQQYQWDYFQDGSIPGQFITPGDSVNSPQQVRELQDALNAMAGDIGAKHRIIVLPPGSKADPQKPVDLTDSFDEWIVSQVTMAFSLAPLDIGISPQRRGMMQNNAESQNMANSNEAKGNTTRLRPVLEWLKAIIFDYVIQDVFGQEDMQWSWGMTTAGDNAEQELEMLVEKVQNGIMSVDEARIDQGLKPWGLPESSVPMIWTGTGPVLLSKVGETPAAPGEPMAPGAHPAPKPPIPPMLPQLPRGETPHQPQVEHTPNHEGAKAVPETQGAPKASGDVPEQKALRAELAVLRRYLARGKDITEFKSAILTPQMLRAGEQQMQEDPTDVAQAVSQVAAAAKAVIDAARRSIALDTIIGMVSRAIQQLTHMWRDGTVAHPTAIDTAVGVMQRGYSQAMTAGTAHAADDTKGSQMQPRVIEQQSTQRAETQRDYITRLMTEGQTAITTETWTARFNQYGATLTGAYNQAFGQTMQQNRPEDGIYWRLGDTCHCKLCLARADKRYTYDDLPGWPGDGGFGDLCEGGPNCGCWLEFVENHRTVDIGTNTQRPDSVAYYAEQNRRITAQRQESAARRREFLDSIPGDAAARAGRRDSVRDQLAAVANHVIQTGGGYPGISVRPEDIPASIVADLTRGGEDPAEARFEAMLMANFLKWDPFKHPRGPHGRFLPTGGEHEHQSHRERQHALEDAFASGTVHHHDSLPGHEHAHPKPQTERPKPDSFADMLGPESPDGEHLSDEPDLRAEAHAVHQTPHEHHHEPKPGSKDRPDLDGEGKVIDPYSVPGLSDDNPHAGAHMDEAVNESQLDTLARGDELDGGHTPGVAGLGDKHVSQSALADAMRRSRAYNEDEVKRAIAALDSHRAEMTREDSRVRREKALVAIGSIVAGFLMAVFVAPLLAAAPLAVAAAVDLMPDTTRSFIEWLRGL